MDGLKTVGRIPLVEDHGVSRVYGSEEVEEPAPSLGAGLDQLFWGGVQGDLDSGGIETGSTHLLQRHQPHRCNSDQMGFGNPQLTGERRDYGSNLIRQASSPGLPVVGISANRLLYLAPVAGAEQEAHR